MEKLLNIVKESNGGYIKMYIFDNQDKARKMYESIRIQYTDHFGEPGALDMNEDGVETICEFIEENVQISSYQCSTNELDQEFELYAFMGTKYEVFNLTASDKLPIHERKEV